VPRLTGLVVGILLAAAGVITYVVAFHPGKTPRTPPLPTRVISYQTVGLVTSATQPGATSSQLLQLRSEGGGLNFSPVAQAQQTEGAPQWTADLMGGATYIFIYLPTGQCLSAVGGASQSKLALRHCNLGGTQRWRRTRAAVMTDGHAFYQYANLGDGNCLTQTGELPGPTFGASLSACGAQQPANQLLAFWWSTL
jgi:hypothetical protein